MALITLLQRPGASMPLLTPFASIRLPSGPPPEGPRVMPVRFQLEPNEIATITPCTIANTLSRVASILIDATRTYTGLQVTFVDSGRTIYVPSGCEVCLMTGSHDGAFTIQNLDLTFRALFKAWLFNCPQEAYERYPGAGAVSQHFGNALDDQIALLTSATSGEFNITGGPRVTTSVLVPPVIPNGAAWSARFATADAVLSEFNLRVDLSNAGKMASTVYRSSGKYYLEYDNIHSGDIDEPFGFGFATSIAGDHALLVATFGNELWLDGVRLRSLSGSGSSVHIGMAIDLDAKLFWYRVNAGSGWNESSGAGPDPATGVGGVDISGMASPVTLFASRNPAAVGALHIKVYSGNAGFGGGFAGIVPAGFTPGWPAI